MQARGKEDSIQTGFIDFQSVDPILDTISTDIKLNDVLESTAILDNIVKNINNSSDVEIQYKSSTSHYNILRASIEQVLTDAYDDINTQLQEACTDFFNEEGNAYNILDRLFNISQEFKNLENIDDIRKISQELGIDLKPATQYTNEQLEEISKLSIDELAEKYKNLESTEIVQDACRNADFLYSNINVSYKSLAKIMLEGIILKYNNDNGKINNYKQFLDFLDEYFMNLSNSNFIGVRRFIINNDDNLEHIDPIVEYAIGTCINAEFPLNQFQGCNLRETGANKVDEVLLRSDLADEYLSNCKNYIINESRASNKGFIDLILNNVFQRHPEYIEDNIQRQSFADYINTKDAPSKTPVVPVEPQKVKVQVDINDPSTWDINTLIRQLGSSNVHKIISDNIENKFRFFPAGKVDNKTYLEIFINAIRTWIGKTLRDSDIINSIKTKADLIKEINTVIDNLNSMTVINIRNNILDTYNNGRDPKFNLIIDKFNSELKKKFNTKVDYLESSTPLYSNLLNYLNNDTYKNRINQAFVAYVSNNYRNNIIYSVDQQKNTQDIHYMYIKFFPSILIDDLYSKNIKALSYMFSDEELKEAIENNLQDTENLFLPKSDECYRKFTQLLIQDLLSNFATIAKNNGNIRPLYMVFGDLRKKYDDILDGDLNSIANKIRTTFFGYDEHNQNELQRKVSDPFISALMIQLFPDLKDIDAINTQSTMARSLAKYIFTTNRDKVEWKGLKSYFEKITSSVFHQNYSNQANSVCYNTVFLDAISVLQIGKDYYNIRQFKEKIKSGKERDTSLPVPESDPDIGTSIDNNEGKEDIITDVDDSIDISTWTLDQLNDYINNKLSDIINLESSFLPAKLLLRFCDIIIKNIYTSIQNLNITSQAELLNKVKQVYTKLATYKAFINMRNRILLRNNIDVDPLITNINNQLPNFKLQKISMNSDLYEDIIQRIDKDLFKDFIDIIGNKYIFDLNNKLYHEYFPDLFSAAEKTVVKNTDTDISADTGTGTDKQIKPEEIHKPIIDKQIKPKEIHKPIVDKQIKSNDTDTERVKILDKSIVDDNSIVRDNPRIYKTDSRLKSDLDESQVRSRLKKVPDDELQSRLRKIPDNELQSYTLDDYTINELTQLIRSYKPSFNIDNEIIKAAIGHIESFNGESYKRIFKPLFEGTFAKQLPTKKFAKDLLKKVQLTALITNERRRFAEFLRIFLFNISDKNHKFFIRESMNQRSIFNKQIRDYLLHNTNITDKINQRLYLAFDKYYNAYCDNELDNAIYDLAFDTLAKAGSIEDSKGDVHQFKDYSLKNKVLIVNDQAYTFNANKSFEEYLHSLDIQESIYNYAQGYIIKNCVFLDPLVNCSEEEAVNILMNDPLQNIKKVYLTINNTDNILTERRLAKLIKRYV